METVLQLLKQHANRDSLIVEVGCGKGDFVEMVQADGFSKYSSLMLRTMEIIHLSRSVT